MYEIESMKSINEKEKVGSVISLFAGTGGSSLGYKMAGLDVKVANEFIPMAVENYKANHKNTIVVDDDIRNIKGADLLKLAGLEVGELDILDGSPPCSPFSAVGKKEKGWGKIQKYSDTKQRVDDLFLEYVRLVNEIKPKVIVAENVKGLTFKNAKPFLDEILDKLGENYKVEYKVLHAKYLGVPQNRPRTIIIGVRKDLGIDPIFPKEDKDNLVTIREAWTNLELDNSEVEMLKNEMIKRSRIYDVLQRMPKNPNKHTDGTVAFNGERKFFSMIRQCFDLPSSTLVVKGGDLSLGSGLIHPLEDRKLTIGESKRLQSFPDDFVLLGTYSQQYERIARSVPPLMMNKIAEVIKKEILKY